MELKYLILHINLLKIIATTDLRVDWDALGDSNGVLRPLEHRWVVIDVLHFQEHREVGRQGRVS